MFALLSDFMLVTMPNHDLATKYASEWSKEIVEVAEHVGVKFLVGMTCNAKSGRIMILTADEL